MRIIGGSLRGKNLASLSGSAIRPTADRLRESFRFYDWGQATRAVRWMGAFDTTPKDVDAFAAALSALLVGAPAAH